jgi:large subunit ribosomal protein L25
MEIQTLQAEVRPGGGKGPARQLRSKGLIPAVFYGPGTEPTSIAVNPKELRKALSTEFGRNQVVELAFGAKKELAVVREVQIHPLEREVIHADFYRVELDREIEQKVPFETKGKAAGVAAGGLLRIIFRELPVRCSPNKVPAKIVVDVTALELHEAIHTRDLTLPEGVVVTLPADRSLVAVVSEDKRGGDEEAAAAAGAAAPAAAGKAAPAAGKAAPAAGKAAPAAAKAAPAAAAKKK